MTTPQQNKVVVFSNPNDKQLAKLLEISIKKRLEWAKANSDVANCVRDAGLQIGSDVHLENVLGAIAEKVTELAHAQVCLNADVDYESAARALLATTGSSSKTA
jgi:hypothetical protein